MYLRNTIEADGNYIHRRKETVGVSWGQYTKDTGVWLGRQGRKWKEKERKKEMEEQSQWDMATERSASSGLLQGIGAASYNQYWM